MLPTTTSRPLLRSLLQKAVRRGYTDLVQRAAFLLASQGDSTWLRARTGVIVFEECWPSALLLASRSPSAMTLQEVAGATKNKDAAGLGSLAHALVEGDTTVLDSVHEPKAVKIVAAALRRPEDFFKWAHAECHTGHQTSVVSAARLFFNRASWPWDKAFLAAGAYISIQEGVPKLTRSEHTPNETFPYWVAVDKHTPQGKSVLRRVAAALRVQDEKLQWASFYLESAKVNELEQCPWWECEATWRLKGMGLSIKDAESLWVQAAEQVKFAVQDEATALCQMLEHSGTGSLLPML
jgi:hypothetical protein